MAREDVWRPGDERLAKGRQPTASGTDSETQEASAPSLEKAGEPMKIEGGATMANSRPNRGGTLRDKGANDATLVVVSSEEEYAGRGDDEGGEARQ